MQSKPTEPASSSSTPTVERRTIHVGARRWRLERCASSGPRYLEAVERCIGEMAAAVGGDGCLAFQLAVAAPRPVVSAVLRGGASVDLAFPTRAVVGRDIKPMRSWEADLPDPHERSHTVTFRYRLRPAHPQDSAVLRSDLIPRGIHDHARRLLYDGYRFLGGVSVERAVDRPLFSPHDLHRLDAVANAHLPRIAAAVALDAELTGTTCALLFTSEGRCLHASPLAERWLSRARRAALADIVRALEREGGDVRASFVGGTTARVVRLRQRAQSRFLVTLRPFVLPLMHPAADLSARQRTVARYASCGATIGEIACTLELSPHTVREHLRRAYRILGVRSRVELARAMESVDEDALDAGHLS